MLDNTVQLNGARYCTDGWKFNTKYAHLLNMNNYIAPVLIEIYWKFAKLNRYKVDAFLNYFLVKLIVHLAV